MKLEITKEKVLEAAEKCSQAKETLKTLFPECFEEIDEIQNFSVSTSQMENEFIFIGNGLAPSNLRMKCFGLNPKYSWELTMNEGYPILIPKLK